MPDIFAPPFGALHYKVKYLFLQCFVAADKDVFKAFRKVDIPWPVSDTDSDSKIAISRS